MTPDPTAGEPRDHINYAVGMLSERTGVTLTEALTRLLAWSSDSGLPVRDIADLVVAGSRVERSERADQPPTPGRRGRPRSEPPDHDGPPGR